MAEVFISYAREDQARARDLAAELTRRGWVVWWDRSLLHGEDFERALEEQLRTAKCVLVLWSRHAEASTWVRNEARFAGERDVLIPVLIEDVPLPLAHSHRQSARLIDGSGESEELEHLNTSIAKMVGRAAPVAPPRRRLPLAGLLVVAAIVIGIGSFRTCSDGEPAREPVADTVTMHFNGAVKEGTRLAFTVTNKTGETISIEEVCVSMDEDVRPFLRFGEVTVINSAVPYDRPTDVHIAVEEIEWKDGSGFSTVDDFLKAKSERLLRFKATAKAKPSNSQFRFEEEVPLEDNRLVSFLITRTGADAVKEFTLGERGCK